LALLGHLAAPTGSEWTSEEAALDNQTLRQRLDAERARLESELAVLREVETEVRNEGAAPESGGIGNHLADEGTQTFDIERSFAMEANLESLMAEVQHALHKFEQGTYGVCDDCGQQIAYERLEALPHASLCIRCKAQREKSGVR
jgi:DnaK suppressor protein